MDIADIPVRVVGPGTQSGSEDEGPSYIDMPHEMQQYDAPIIPGPDEVQHLAVASEAMAWLTEALAAYQTDQPPQIADLNHIDNESRKLINQILGEGEVSITYNGTPRAHVQESVLAGVWRTLYFDDDGKVAIDLLEVADVPHIVFADRDHEPSIDLSENADAENMPNALPVLFELDDHCRNFELNGNPQSINLTLMPLSQAELEFIDERLGRGPVDILSRAYGKCQVISTRNRHVWWVRYYNAMGTLILNSLEVTNVPMVVAAASEDISDSANRLEEILLPYWPKTA